MGLLSAVQLVTYKLSGHLSKTVPQPTWINQKITKESIPVLVSPARKGSSCYTNWNCAKLCQFSVKITSYYVEERESSRQTATELDSECPILGTSRKAAKLKMEKRLVSYQFSHYLYPLMHTCLPTEVEAEVDTHTYTKGTMHIHAMLHSLNTQSANFNHVLQNMIRICLCGMGWAW